MMSATSKARLAQAHPSLILLFEKVAETVDIVVLEAHRELEQEAQNIAKGVSHLKDPMNCLHCRSPSLAVDAAATPVDWNDTEAFNRFALDVVKPAADELGIKVRWGGAWNDIEGWTLNPPHSFNDLDHFELVT